MAQTYEMNLIKLLDEFDSDGDCRVYLERLRWPNGVACLECGDTSISRITTRDNPFIFRDALRELVQAQRLHYAELTATH